ETGIAEDDLVEAARGRVAIVSRLHVCGERGAHLRQTREKLCGTIGRRPVGYVASVFNLLAVIDRATDLLGQRLVEPSHTRFDVQAKGRAGQALRADVTGKQQFM